MSLARAQAGKRSGRGGAALIIALVLTMLAMSLSAVIFGAVGAQSTVRRITHAKKLSFSAAETGLSLRLAQANAGDLGSNGRSYAFGDGSSALVSLVMLDATQGVVEAEGHYGQLRTTLRALVAVQTDALQLTGVHAGDSLTVGANAEISLAFDSRAGLPGSGGATMLAEARANNVLILEQDALIHGHARAGEKIILGAGAAVAGTAQAPLIIGDSSQAGSISLSQPDLEPLPPSDPKIDAKLAEVSALATALPDLSVGKHDVYTLGPGAFAIGSIAVAKLGQLVLVGPLQLQVGKVLVHKQGSLEIQGALTIVVDGSNGEGFKSFEPLVFSDRGDGYADAHVEIYSKSKVTFASKGNAVGVPPQPFDFQVWMASGSKFEIQDIGPYFGSIYNPRGTVQLKQAVDLFGMVVGDHVIVADDQSIHFDLALRDQLQIGPQHFVITAVAEVSP